MNRADNPFTPGAGVLPPELAGRKTVIEDGDVLAARTIAHCYERGLMLIGPRGVGKTVLLKYMAEASRSRGVIPVRVEIRKDGGDIEQLSRRLKDALCTIDFKCRIKNKVNAAFATLGNFVEQFSINIGELGLSVEPRVSVGGSGNMEYDLSEVLLSVATAAKESDTAVGLYIDELQNLDVSTMSGIIVALHSAAQDSLPLYLVGSGLPTIRALVGKSKTYAERMFVYHEIGPLDMNDTADAIRSPLKSRNAEIDDAAISAIFEISSGYPFFIQECGYAAWNIAAGNLISCDDVTAALPMVMQNLDRNFFDVRFDRVSPREREFLYAMSDLGEAPQFSAVAERMGGTLASLSRVRASLISKGMIYSPSLGRLAYTVPMFGEYMKRIIPKGIS